MSRPPLAQPFADLPLTAAASAFVETSHEGRKYGTRPYAEHLYAVYVRVRAAIPADHPHRDEACAAAWLHDDYEDTTTTREEVRAQFGPLVDAVVFACTGSERGTDIPQNRRFRNAAIAGKFQQLCAPNGKAWWIPPGVDCTTAHQLAQIVKCCDRTANVDACWAGRDPRLFMYRDEHDTFRTLFRDAPGWVCAELAKLDRLLGFFHKRAKTRTDA